MHWVLYSAQMCLFVFQSPDEQTERPESPLVMAVTIRDEFGKIDLRKLADCKNGVASHFCFFQVEDALEVMYT